MGFEKVVKLGAKIFSGGRFVGRCIESPIEGDIRAMKHNEFNIAISSVPRERLDYFENPEEWKLYRVFRDSELVFSILECEEEPLCFIDPDGFPMDLGSNLLEQVYSSYSSRYVEVNKHLEQVCYGLYDAKVLRLEVVRDITEIDHKPILRYFVIYLDPKIYLIQELTLKPMSKVLLQKVDIDAVLETT